MPYTNVQMEQMLESLKPLLRYSNRIGYAAARNARRLTDELTEYLTCKSRLLAKYGTPEVDADGTRTGRYTVSVNSDEGMAYLREIAQYVDIEHEPNLMLLPFSEAEGVITGAELLDADWMFFDEEHEEKG